MVEDRARLTLTPGSMGARVLPLSTSLGSVPEEDDVVSDTSYVSDVSVAPRDPYTNVTSDSDNESDDAVKMTKQNVCLEPQVDRVVHGTDLLGADADATKACDAIGNAPQGRISIVEGPRVIHDQHHVKKRIALVDVDVSSESENDCDVGIVKTTNNRGISSSTGNDDKGSNKSLVNEIKHPKEAISDSKVAELVNNSLLTLSVNDNMERVGHTPTLRRAGSRCCV